MSTRKNSKSSSTRSELDSGLADLDDDPTRVSCGSSSPSEAPREASLVEIYGPNLGRRISIERTRMRLGRGLHNDVILDDDSVSREHALIRTEDAELVLQDLGSTNGTYVNDRSVDEVTLRNSDIIKIGSVIYKFITGGNAESLYHEEIYRMTITDGLTGIPNRRHLMEFLERELARATRYGRPLALAMLDIDHFKQINDTYSHLAGDAILRRMAADLRTSVRKEQLFARYGGEEFGLVMPETPLSHAQTFCEKLRRRVAETSFTFEHYPIGVTVSIGIATAGEAEETVEEFIAQADAQLYRAKRLGRNRICVAPE